MRWEYWLTMKAWFTTKIQMDYNLSTFWLSPSSSEGAFVYGAHTFVICWHCLQRASSKFDKQWDRYEYQILPIACMTSECSLMSVYIIRPWAHWKDQDSKMRITYVWFQQFVDWAQPSFFQQTKVSVKSAKGNSIGRGWLPKHWAHIPHRCSLTIW